MRRVLALSLVLLAMPAAADLPEGVYKTARPIVMPSGFTGGTVYLPLDDAALEAGSLTEYRIVRDGEAETPYRMVLEDGSVLEEELPSTVVDWTEAGAPDSMRIVVDLGGEAPRANLLRLALTGDDFSAAVVVAGSRERAESPSVLATGRVYRRGAGFEKTSLALGSATQRYLHLTLTRKEGKLPKVDAVRVFSTLTIPRRTASVSAAMGLRQDAKRKATVVELDPGRRLRDLGELRFAVAEPVFDRPVTVEVAYAEPAEGQRIAYTWWAGARLAGRKPSDPVVIEQLIPTARYVRISIANGDDQPLTVKGVELVRTRRGLAFSAAPGGRYELWYGREQAPAPSYDLSKLPLMRPDMLAEAKLGTARALALAPPPPPPWSERHPGLFWGALVGVAILLLAVIIRAMRMAGSAAQDGPQ